MRQKQNGCTPSFYWDIPGTEFEAEYIDLVYHILTNGSPRGDRTGTGVRNELLKRRPYPPPRVQLKPAKWFRHLFEIRYRNITLQDYQAHPSISAPIAV